jgi:hypothetical protein
LHGARAGVHSREGPDNFPRLKQILLIVAAIVVALLLTQFLFDFYEWDQEQACASAGGRNCAGGATTMGR